MRYDPLNHHRNSIRLKGYDYSRPGAYFVTTYTKGRLALFGKVEKGEMIMNDAGQVVEQCWLDLPKQVADIRLGAHMVMPDHFHGILIITDGEGDPREKHTLREIAIRAINVRAINVRAIHESPSHTALSLQDTLSHNIRQDSVDIKTRRRMTLSKLMGHMKMQSAKRINLLSRTPGRHMWQRDYYEHIIRDELEYDIQTAYIQNNPKNWQ